MLASWYVSRLVDAMKLLAGCDKKGSEGAGFEVDPSYVYNRSKFFRGAEYKRRTERGGDDTCQSIVSLLLPTSYRVWIAIVKLSQSRWRIVVRMQCQSKKSTRIRAERKRVI